MNNYSTRGITAAAAIAILSLMADTATARQLTPEQALLRAQRVDASVMQTMSAETSTPELAYTATSADGDINTIYVFNRGNNQGFMMVSADDESDAALLGYADSGEFGTDGMPENIEAWLGQYSDEIAIAVNGTSARTSVYSKFGLPQLSVIEPFVTTRWNQTSPYNTHTPMRNGKHMPTGCVATAMAQAMKVYNYPAHGTGVKTYRVQSINTTITANLADSTFNWGSMTDTYSTTNSSYSEIDAVSTLMSVCGISVSMQYNSTASNSNYTSAARALVTNFNYDKGIRLLYRDCYGFIDWVKLLHDELAEGRPILYSGTNEENGHAFVLDGYDGSGYFHVNWGWGGTSNGYFLLTAMNPTDQGVGGGSTGYSNGQSAIIGIQPAREGSTVIPVFQFGSSFKTSQNYARSAATIRVIDRKGIYNQSVSSVIATPGIKIVDIAGNETYVPSTTTKSFSSGSAITGYDINMSDLPQTLGKYKVSPVVRDEQGKWWDCEVKMTNNRTLDMTVTADSVIFDQTKVARITATDVEVLSPIYPGKECAFRCILTNNSDEEFYEKVAPTLVLDHVDKAQCDPLAVELLPGQSGEFMWIGDFPTTLQPGEYLMWFVDGNSLDVSTEGVPVTVYAAPTEATAYTLTLSTLDGSNRGTQDAPAIFEPEHLRFRATVECTQGYFSDNIEGVVFHADGRGVEGFTRQYIAAPAGTTATSDYDYDGSDLVPGELYYMLATGTHCGRVGNKLYFTVDALAGVQEIGSDARGSELTATHIDDAHIQVKSADVMAAASIYSIEGKCLSAISNVGDTVTTFNIDNLPNGIYLISAQLTTGEQRVLKVVL